MNANCLNSDTLRANPGWACLPLFDRRTGWTQVPFGEVVPDFLTFLMMSDRFMNRIVEISLGSLSPTINWKTLKLEEFDIPSLDQQLRFA
ncbi:MAG: hypothetical protein JW706_04330 [Opitutales bacterium]|nr:hypothetical protein [Opitutales bacterium]